MINTAKQILLLVASVISFVVNAQTNVSGGIYSNTTWSLSGSPYIITDTVVIFPGVTLTIQPGVTVKFADGKLIEIRQAKLIATGTNTAPIIFTSNSSSPTPGIYQGIYVNGGTTPPVFTFCSFKYMSSGIYTNNNYTLTIKNSSFNYNNNGIQGTVLHINLDSCIFRYNTSCMVIGGGTISNCRINQNVSGMMQEGIPSAVTNCQIDSNQNGISGNTGSISDCSVKYNTGTGISSAGSTTINNCQIISNHTGVNFNYSDIIQNSIIDSNSALGISAPATGNTITNCTIRYNATGISDFLSGPPPTNRPINSITKNTITNNNTGILLAIDKEQISCNKICNNTSFDLKYTGTNNTTAAHNYWCTADSSSTEAVIYDGYDNASYGLIHFMPNDSCYLSTGISTYEGQSFSYKLFPNPATNYITVELPTDIFNADIKIFNTLGELMYVSKINVQKANMDVSSFTSGLYFIEVSTGNSSTHRFIKQ